MSGMKACLNVMPDHIGQPHLPLWEWALPQRQASSAIVHRYLKFQPSFAGRADPRVTKDCLGVHVRWSDKGVARRRLGLDEFLPFVQAYLQGKEVDAQGGPSNACVYLATDATAVVKTPVTLGAVLRMVVRVYRGE